MNDELRTALRELVLAAGPHWATAIENSLANSKCEILALNPDSTSGSAVDRQATVTLGGRPLVPADFSWPRDRGGQLMQFLLQVDLKEILPPQQYGLLMPTEGRLTVFRSAQILTMADKDRKAFQLTIEITDSNCTVLSPPLENPPPISPPLLPAHAFTTESVWSLDVEKLNIEMLTFALPQNFATALLGWALKYNLYTCGHGYFFGSGRNVEEEKEICAFAAGGISWDRNRSRDSHYSHLTALKDNWILLARICEGTLFQNGSGEKNKITSSDILIQKDDLAQGLFERAWLISR